MNQDQETYQYNSNTYTRMACKNCGLSIVEEGYDYPLCQECRSILVKRPFPLGIKIFFILIIGVVIFSLVGFPKTIKAGMAYERGKRAEEEKKYLTAMEQYEIAYNNYSDSQDLIGKLIIAKYKNGKISDANELFNDIYDIDIKDEQLYEELNKINEELMLYYPSEALVKVLNENSNSDMETVNQVLTEYITQNPHEIAAKYYLADTFYELEQFNECEIIINFLRKQYPDNISLCLYLAAIEREQGNYDVALAYCKNALTKNIENVAAYNAMAVLELKQSHDDKALEYIEQAYALDDNDINVLDTIVMVYHYKGMQDKRDSALEKIKAHADHQDSQLQFLNDFINGKIQWR